MNPQILAIDVVISVTETQDVINHRAPPPQPGFIGYLWAKLSLNCQSKANDACNRDARSCRIQFYSNYLSCRQYDYNYWNSASITVPVDVTGGCEFPVSDVQTLTFPRRKKGSWFFTPNDESSPGCNSLLTLLWLTAGAWWHLLQLGKPSSCSCQTIHSHMDTQLWTCNTSLCEYRRACVCVCAFNNVWCDSICVFKRMVCVTLFV